MTNPTPPVEGTGDSALRRAESDLHPHDPMDTLSTGAVQDPDAGADEGPEPDGDLLDDTLPDAPLPDAALPGDTVPGDGTVDGVPSVEQADALRTAEYGRESEAAAANISDSTPTPTETPVDGVS